MRDFNTFDVLSHELKARKGQNGHSELLQEPLQDAPEQSLDFRSLLSGEMTLAVRTSTGEPAVLKVPHSLLAIVATMFLAAVGAGFWLVSSVTEMKTNLATIKENQRELKNENGTNLQLMTAYATNETNRINFLTGLLSEESRKALYEYDATHPRPPLPKPRMSERSQDQ